MDNNEFDNVVILDDGEGNEVKFEFLDLIEYEGEEYVVLLPMDEDDEEGMVVILKVEDGEGDQESYCSVEDNDVLTAVFEIFKENFKDEFNFL